MALLATNSPSGQAIRAGRKTQARVKADKKVKDLVGTLAPSQEDLKAKMALRVTADDHNIDAEEELDARETDLQDALGSLSAKAHGLYESYEAPGYRRILEIAPSKVISMSEADRRAQYVKTFDALKDDTPKELAVSAKAAVSAYADYNTAYEAATTTGKALKKALELEEASLDHWHTAIRRLKGQLIDRYPRDNKRVAKFFSGPGAKPKKAVAAAEANDPNAPK